MTIKNKISKLVTLSIFSLTLPFMSAQSFASGTGHTHEDGMMMVGEAGEASHVTRTIEIQMYDNYYEPEAISINEGETIRFVIKNSGDFVHEFNIGTSEMHMNHQEEMAMMVDHGVIEPDKINHDMMGMDMGEGHMMSHDDPNSRLMEPGASDEIIWKFSTASKLEFACNIPGHYDSGMAGTITFGQ